MSHSSFSVKLTSNESEFIQLSSDWNQLVGKTNTHPLFLHHEWFRSAWQWRKIDSELRVLSVYNETNQLIGICPFILETQTGNLYNLKVFKFLTVPDTQFCDIIADPQYTNSFINTIIEWLVRNKNIWDIIDLTHIPKVFSRSRSLYQTVEQIFYSTFDDFDVNLSIDMTDSWDDFYAHKSRRLKKGNNLVANKIKKEKTFEIKWFGQRNEIVDTDTLIANITDISSKCWKAETGLSLDNAAPYQFISTLTKLAQENGWLSVWILFFDTNPVAMEYQLIYKSNVYALRSDFSEEYSKLSPGTFLNWKLLETLFDTDAHSYYMGPGQNEYKKRWNNSEEKLCRLKIYNNNLIGNLSFYKEKKLKPFLKTIRSVFTKNKEKA